MEQEYEQRLPSCRAVQWRGDFDSLAEVAHFICGGFPELRVENNTLYIQGLEIPAGAFVVKGDGYLPAPYVVPQREFYKDWVPRNGSNS